MNKSEMADKLADKADISKAKATEVIDHLFVGSLGSGDRAREDGVAFEYRGDEERGPAAGDRGGKNRSMLARLTAVSGVESTWAWQAWRS